MSDESLYDRLGGEHAIDGIVDLFYKKVLADDRIKRFFDDVDMESQRLKQKAFLIYSFGGPIEYTGKSLREAHEPLLKRGLCDSHFIAICEHLVATLNELGAPPDAVVEVLTFLESKRDDVLCR